MGDFLTYGWQSDAWLGIIWIASYLWINVHVWYPKSPRLAATEAIFGTPSYDGLFIDQVSTTTSIGIEFSLFRAL